VCCTNTDDATRKDEPMVTLMPNRSVLDRPRHAASHAAVSNQGGNWRLGTVAPTFGGTTGLFTDACSAYVNQAWATPTASKHAIKRPARHLGTRST
jgi:hypothetical protein